jgi:hypothetical protein
LKLLFLILLLPCIVKAQNGDPIPRKLTKEEVNQWPKVIVEQGQKQKYDTIGPVWRLVSDTIHFWNLASAMQVYEVVQKVRKYRLDEGSVISWKHIEWLDSKKKPLTLKVWEEYK